MAVETKYIHTDVTPVRQGICMMPEIYEQTFTVVVRSMHPVSESKLKDVIDSHYEVESITLTASTCVVKNSK